MWSKDPDRDGALLACQDTPLQFEFSPAELLYGRQIGTSLGFRPKLPADFEAFEKIAMEQAYERRTKWNRKHHAKPLSKLDPGQKVWIKAANDVGREGLVLKYDAYPNGVLVQSQGAIYCRDRKHIFPLSDESNAYLVPLTGNDPYTAVSNDCIALCDDNTPLSNPTPNFCTVEGNNPDSPDNFASVPESKVELDMPSEDEPVTAAPAEPERCTSRWRVIRSMKQNDFYYPN